MSRLLIIISTCIFLLTACGGGSGGSDSVSDETVYDLTQYKTLEEGEKYYFSMTGSDNTGLSWTGELGAYVWPPVAIEGENFIEEVKAVSLTETSSGIPMTKIWSVVYNRFEEPIVMYFPFSGFACLADTINLLPDYVMIGDVGETTSYRCQDADETSISGVWSIEKGSGDNAYLIIDTTYFNGINDTSYDETEKFEIDLSGKLVSASFSINSEGYTLILSSE